MNLDFAKVCGKHSAIYEAYYKQIDAKGSGAIEAMTAAKFLKKSGLSDVVLSRIWDLSDPNGKGFLDKPGFFVALKLVSLAQCGQVISMSSIYTETANPPKVGDLPKIMPPRIQTVPVSSGGVASGDWSISVIDRLKYEQLFESLKPVGGMLPGNKVKGVLMDSKLPMDTLGKIWDLADQDKDGNLDKHEFIVAMHLVYQTLDKRTVPDVLPVELRKPGAAGGHGVPPPKPAPPVMAPAMPRAPSGEGFGDGGFVANFPKDIAPPPAPVIPTLPVVPPMTRVPPVGSASVGAPLIGSIDPLIPIGAPPSVTANADWVVTPAELKRFEVMFRDSDRDKDGLVSGLEVKNVFLQSGVPQNCLAHIWALCDTNQSGKLTLEQFALAMWMVERKQKGIEPPQALIANMVPPSMRATVSGIDMQPQEPKPAYSNPELEMISKEIEELAKERRSLETEIAQKEADLRIKTGEVRSLQSELDTLSATLKQLENQRGEAQKRLDDLMAQVNKIREQSQKQEETISEQEGELNAKRSELQKLKDEETALQKEYDDNNRELQKLTQHLQNTQLQISSVRSMVTQLMETQRQMTDALLMCRAAIENQDGELVTEYQLKIEPDFDEAHRVLERKVDEPKEADPFEDNKSAAKTNGNGFATNGFDSDPFGGSVAVPAAAAAATTVNTARGGFDDSFNTSHAFDPGFDAFAGSGFGQQKDPFGGDAFVASVAEKKSEAPKDDFGSDPFAALHAPTGQGQVLSPNASQKSVPPPRPESPSPALPPKKSKVPPPRPAPPRPNQGPARPAQPAMDAFGSASAGGGGGSGGFADFADFDNKLAASATPSSNFSLLFDPLADATNNPNASTLSGTASNTTITSSSLLSHTSTLHHHHPHQQQQQQQTTESLYNTLAECTSSGSGVGGGSKLQSNSASPSSSSFTSLNFNNNNNQTATTTNLTNSNLNNHLTRSITPLQQAAAANAFNTLPPPQPAPATSTAAAALTLPTTAKDKLNVRGPTDFSDDPFKDYRYEDPFNIKDPFADDDDNEPITDPEKIFTESSVVQVVKDTAARSQTPSASNTSLSSDFMDKFSQFSMNPSPVPSHKSSNSLGFSAFDDVAAKPSALASSSRNTPVATTAFADFDAFASKAAAPLPRTASPFGGGDLKASKDRLNANRTPQDTQESKANDSFYDAFGDRFAGSAASKANNNNISSNTTLFDDPFGETKATTDTRPKTSDPFGGLTAFGDAFATNATPVIAAAPAATTFDAFNDNTFEDDFFGVQKASSVGGNNNNNNTSTKNGNGLDFAKFDAFGDDFASAAALNNSKNVSHPAGRDSVDGGGGAALASASLPGLVKVQNQTTLTKRPNLNANMTAADSGKLPEKFVADYSKAETFEDDMQEAIRRSMMEQ